MDGFEKAVRNNQQNSDTQKIASNTKTIFIFSSQNFFFINKQGKGRKQYLLR